MVARQTATAQQVSVAEATQHSFNQSPLRSRRTASDRTGYDKLSTLSPVASARPRRAPRWRERKTRPAYGRGRFQQTLDTDEYSLTCLPSAAIDRASRLMLGSAGHRGSSGQAEVP